MTTKFLRMLTRLSFCLIMMAFAGAGVLSAQATEPVMKKINFSIDLRDISKLNGQRLEQLGIRGSLAPLSWHQSVLLSDTDNDGIYRADIVFNQPAGAQLEYKLVLQGGLVWEQGDARKLPLTDHQDINILSPNFQARSANPFVRYLGNWQFDQAGFSMVWDGRTVTTQALKGQVTRCREVNTDRSILCVVSNTSDPNWTLGHMFWAYNSQTKEVSWLSHFFPDRIGVGSGSIDEHGNMRVKVTFQGEPEDTYRIYQWRWDSSDSYTMMSRQYSRDGEATGNWYGGRFIQAKE